MNPTTYWERRAPATEFLPEHRRAEGLIRRHLPTMGPIASVLDVGCGNGRMGTLLAEVLPAAHYSGLDVGAAQLAATRAARPDATLYRTAIQDFPLDIRYDLVLASEVLMHIAPADIAAVCSKLLALARRYVITVDWTEPIEGKIGEWNWRHDYRQWFKGTEHRIGLQTMYVIEVKL